MHIVERVSTFTGKRNQMVLPISPEEFAVAHNAWRSGMLVQDAFPTLNAVQREFIITGMSEEEQDFLFEEEYE